MPLFGLFLIQLAYSFSLLLSSHFFMVLYVKANCNKLWWIFRGNLQYSLQRLMHFSHARLRNLFPLLA